MNINEMYGTEIAHVKGLKFVQLTPLKKRNTGSFSAVLYPEDAERLRNLGWKIKEYVRPSDPDGPVEYSISIYVSYYDQNGNLKEEDWIPHISQDTDGIRRFLSPEEVSELGEYRFVDAAFVINPSKTGTAYLEQGLFYLDTNPPKSQNGYVDRWADRY
jgi:hypothetical protein